MKILKNKKYSILKVMLSYGFVFVFLFSFFITTSVFALDGTNANINGANNLDGTNANITVETTIDNPLGSGNLEDIPSFIEAIIRIILTVGVPIVTLAIIYSGFLFVEAQGNPEKLKKAKNALMYTLIGAALLLGAWVLAEAIGATVDDIKRTT